MWDSHSTLIVSSLPTVPPRFMWRVDDLAAVRDHLQALRIEMTMDITDVGSVDILQFSDPDGNVLMVSGPSKRASDSP